MKLLVLDANVAAKCFLPPASEGLVEEAREILYQYQDGKLNLVVPGFFWAEVGNIFWKNVRLGRWTRSSALDATEAILDHRLPTVPDFELLSKAVAIALAEQQAVYDSLYLALALREDAEMITADERLVNSTGARFPVSWLGAWRRRR